MSGAKCGPVVEVYRVHSYLRYQRYTCVAEQNQVARQAVAAVSPVDFEWGSIALDDNSC